MLALGKVKPLTRRADLAERCAWQSKDGDRDEEVMRLIEQRGEQCRA
jgi:predicted Fe-S protein YdhL (DUF1289 family)